MTYPNKQKDKQMKTNDLDRRHFNPGRPKGTYKTNSANYKLIKQLFGSYISETDMTKAQMKLYKNSLSVFNLH